MQGIYSSIEQIIQFFKTDIWHLNSREMPGTRSFWIPPTQVLLLTIRGFVRDNCALRASALTFYSLLSVVPMAALAFGITKGFGLEKRLESLLYEQLSGQEAVVEKIIAFSKSLIENTQGGLIAGIGIAILFWSALKAISHIEAALNEIWKVKSRTFVRKFTDYLAIIILSPLMVIVSSSVTVFIKTQVTTIAGQISLLEKVSPAISYMLQLLPYGLICLLFFLIYLVMPNTRVKILSALIAGVIAGTIFQLTQNFYIHAQVLLARYNAIYGSFAALPFFLLWMQLSWIIVLIGAQIAYAYQHVGQFAMFKLTQDTSEYARKQYAVQILHAIIRRFENLEPPAAAEQLADTLQIPYPLVIPILDQLASSGLISTVRLDNDDTVYQPARDINKITIADMLERWDKVGSDDRPTVPDENRIKIKKALEDLADELKQMPANRLIKNI